MELIELIETIEQIETKKGGVIGELRSPKKIDLIFQILNQCINIKI
jgi:hypothetical protein